MAYNALPSSGSTSWYNHYRDLDYATSGVVQLDSFAGANDDAKLTAALSYASSQTRIPWIQFPGRTINLSSGGRVPFTGMKLCGPGGPSAAQNPEIGLGSGSPNVNHRINLSCGTGTSAWFNGAAAGTIYAVTVANLNFVSTGRTAQFWHGPYSGGANLYSAMFHNLSFIAMRHIFGTSTQAVAVTGVEFSGFWIVNSFLDQTGSQNPMQFHLEGSEAELWTKGWLNIEGSDPAGNNSTFMIHLDGLNKTNVGAIYPTARYGWKSIRISGSASEITFVGSARPEGRNAGSPCHGTLVRIDGGSVVMRDTAVRFGMGAPSSYGGGNDGLIQITGGQVLLDGLRYERATGVAESVPLVYASGGTVDARVVHTRGSWSGKPRIAKTSGATVYADDRYWTEVEV